MRYLPLLLMFMSGVVHAQTNDAMVCADLRRLDEVAGRTGSFQSLVATGFRPRFLRFCSLTAEGISCGRNVTPGHITPASISATMRQCLPGTSVSIERPRFSDPVTVVRTRNLRFTLSENCTERCRAGRIMHISGEILPRGREVRK